MTALFHRCRYAVAIGIFFVISANAPAYAGDEKARQFIDNIGTEILNVLNDEATGDKAKESALRTIFRQKVDVDWIGKFVLGKHWRSANDEQQNRYLKSYRDFVVKSYTSRFQEYTGSETYKILSSKTLDNGKHVVTMELVRPGEANVLVDYKLREGDAGLKIYDIVVEGVSLLTTQRSEFASVISRKGLNYLIEQLEKRANS